MTAKGLETNLFAHGVAVREQVGRLGMQILDGWRLDNYGLKNNSVFWVRFRTNQNHSGIHFCKLGVVGSIVDRTRVLPALPH